MADLPRLSDHFVLGRTLGEGGFGVVFEGRRKSDGFPVAAKIARENSLAAEIPRLLREVELIGRLDHPRLARLLGLYLADEGRLALVYELVPGVPLPQRRAAAPLSRERIFGWIEDIGQGVDALHQAGILHRDIKPENVLVEPNERARLLDFGLARSEGQGGTLTATGVILGTPHFMAPEAIRGDPLGKASDLFALAALGYSLLAGTPPFPGKSLGEILKAQGHPPPPLDPLLDPVFQRALSPRPEHRLESGRALAAALRSPPQPQDESPGGASRSAATRVLRTGPARAAPSASSPTSAILPPPPPPTPRKTRLPGVLATTLAVGIGLYLWVWGQPSAKIPAPLASPVPRSSVRPEVSPLPTSLARDIREQLTNLQGVLVDRRGEELPEDLSSPPPGSHPLLYGDPQDWPRIHQRLPSLVLFLDWIGAGGQPEDLDPRLRTDLLETDQYFLENQLPRPLYAYFQVPPTAPLPLPPRVRRLLEEDFPGLPRPETTTGWTALTWSHLEACLAGIEIKQQDLDGDRSSLPREIQNAHIYTGALLADTVTKVIRGCFSLTSIRTPACRWVRPELEELRATLYAAGRSLRNRNPDSELGAFVLERLLSDSFSGLMRSHLIAWELPWLLGSLPEETPLGASLCYRVAYEQYRAWDSLEGVHAETEEREDAARGYLLAGMEASQAEGELQDNGRLRVYSEMSAFLLSDQDFQGLAKHYLSLLGKYPQNPKSTSAWYFLQGFMAIGLLRADEPLGLSEAQILEIADSLEHRAPSVLTHLIDPSPNRESRRSPLLVSPILDRSKFLTRLQEIAHLAASRNPGGPLH